MPVRDLNWQLGLELQEPPGGSTIGGVCISLAGGRIPETGEKLVAPDGTALVVVEHSPRRVRVVRIFPPATRAVPAGDAKGPAESGVDGRSSP
jgi:putative hemolysin